MSGNVPLNAANTSSNEIFRSPASVYLIKCTCIVWNQVDKFIGASITSLSVRRSPDFTLYLPCLSQYSCEPKPHSYVYHGRIHKYRIRRHGVIVRSCRLWENCSIYIVWLHHIPCSPKLFNGSGKEVPLTSKGLFVMLKGGIALPTLKRTYCIPLKRPVNEYPNPCAWNRCASQYRLGGSTWEATTPLPSLEGSCNGSNRFCTPC